MDVASERAIGQALLDLRGTMTIVLISHRGELLKLADKVILLEAGRLRSLLPGELDEIMCGDAGQRCPSGNPVLGEIRL